MEENTEEDVQVEVVKNPAKEILATNSKGAPVRSAPKKKIDLPLDLLDGKKSKPTSGDIKVGREKIQKTLENFHINVEWERFKSAQCDSHTFAPADGVKLSKLRPKQ